MGVPNKGSHALRRFMISAARSSGARSDVLEQITHNARGAIIDVYMAWEWPALCEAVSCLKVGPERLPGRTYDICVSQNANPRQSLRLFGGGGGNRTAGSSRDSDDSRTVSGTGIDENTSKEHEQNALPDILVTMSQIPDVNRELAEVGAMFDVFSATKDERSKS
jgi:hypothetical protein